MKNLQKVFILVITIFICSIISGCANNNKNSNPDTSNSVQLSAPVPTWNNGVISWDSVDNASKYEVSINNIISYTYETEIKIDVSTSLQHYDIKIKSISEDLNYTNSEFSDELSFDTLKLYSPNLSYTINHSAHLVTLNWKTSNLYADFYELYLNGAYHSKISSSDINSYVNENESYIINNITCSYSLNGDIFSVGTNQFYIKAISNNKYYLPSNNSNIMSLNKNSQYTNIRVENGQLLYNDNSIYNIDYDMVTKDYNFPVINKEIPDSTSVIDPKEHTLWSDPVYVNIYRIHYPKIIECIKNTDSIDITIQGYDPSYVGTEHKKTLGYDYDKIEFIFFLDTVKQFSIIKNSNCLDEEIFILTKLELVNNNCSIEDINKISIIAHKDGYVSSKIFTFNI